MISDLPNILPCNLKQTRWSTSESIEIDVEATDDPWVQIVTICVPSGNRSGFPCCSVKIRGTVCEAANKAMTAVSSAVGLLGDQQHSPDLKEASEAIRKDCSWLK